jgi:hypothetical protein
MVGDRRAAEAPDVMCDLFIGGEVKTRFVLAVAIAGVLMSGCSQVRDLSRPVSPLASMEATRAPELVRVPGVADAIRSSDTTATYEQDPQELADQLQASVERYYAERGLKAEVEFQSIVLPDSQEPSAGALVPRGTNVQILIGFGD